MKETKKILKNPDTFEKINKYVSDNLNFENCTNFTKKFLNNFATYTTESPAVTNQAKILANNTDDFTKLSKKVFDNLNDDKNFESLKRGLSVDMMDLYLPKIVQKLQNLKDNKMPYKNLQPEIVADLFKKDENGITLIEDLFFNALKGRVRNTIINTVQSATKIS